MLLGLTGCGDNNQSDTSQTNTQVSTLQKAEATPAVANYNLAASPRAMSAVAPLQGWNVLSSATLGAETIIEAGKGQLGSIASIRPNAKQVAEVLRGGAAGIALTIAVDQLLGAVDWVMDPTNNQIVYTVKPKDPLLQYYFRIVLGSEVREFPNGQASCDALRAYYVSLNAMVDFDVSYDGSSACNLYGGENNYNGNIGALALKIKNPYYNPQAEPEKKTLSLEVVAEQVISNADVGSLDAQVATNIASQNILNDVVQAESVVQELEENAKYAGRAPRANIISHDRENEILDMKPNDPCDEISEAIKDLDETINWRKSDLNPKDVGKPVYVGHQKRIRILNNKKEDLGRAFKVWCEGK